MNTLSSPPQPPSWRGIAGSAVERTRRSAQARRSASSTPAAAAFTTMESVESMGSLHSGRLVLRPFELEDFEAVHAYDNDPEVLKYLGMAPRTDEGTRAFLAWAHRVSEEDPRRYWPFAIALRAEQQLIGGCCLRVAADIVGGLDCGLEINRHYWNRGYGTEALRELVRYAFQGLHARCVFAECHRDNVRSQRVLSKAGMRQESFPEARKADLVRDGLWNEDQFWSVRAHPFAAIDFQGDH